jgi:hypothetical protein
MPPVSSGVGNLMRSYLSWLGLVVAVCAVSTSARADVDLEIAGLIGTGVDTGNAPNNPYALQVGATAELILWGYVVGARATRSFGTDSDSGRAVNDLRTLGADLGYEWELSLLHIGPRLGIGQISERNGGFKAPYLEPGAVAEVEIGWFAAGVDVRYRVAINNTVANGFLVFGKLGLRF